MCHSSNEGVLAEYDIIKMIIAYRRVFFITYFFLNFSLLIYLISDPLCTVSSTVKLIKFHNIYHSVEIYVYIYNLITILHNNTFF